MDSEAIVLPSAQGFADQDRELLTVYRGAALVAGVGSAYGLYMAGKERLTRSERICARVATTSLAGVGGLAVADPVRFAGLLRHRVNPWTLPLAGLAAVAGTGGDRSPMFFPAVILSALGGGRLGTFRWPRQTASARMGIALGVGYGCIVLGSRRPWKYGWDRQLLWNLGVVPAFVAAPLVGGDCGDLALSIRRLESLRARDRAALAQLDPDGRDPLPRLVDAVGEISSSLEENLLGLTRIPLPTDPSEKVSTSVTAIRERIAHHQLAPVLIAAARDEQLDLGSTLNGVLNVYERAWKDDVDLRFEPAITEGMTVSPRVVGLLVRALKLGLDNAAYHQTKQLEVVVVSLAMESDHVVLRVEDDGGGTTAPPREEWRGLSTLEGSATELRGTLDLDAAAAGMALTIRIPATPVPASTGTSALVSERLEAVLDRCQRYMLPSNVLAGILGALTSGTRGRSYAAAFGVAAGADELWRRASPAGRTRPALMLPLVGTLWPPGGVPAGGWLGAELIFDVMRSRASDAWLLSALTACALAGSGRRVRDSIDAAKLWENILFAPFCALAGVGPRYLRARLRAAEHETVSLRERWMLVEELTVATGYTHDIVKRLRGSNAWYQHALFKTDEAQALLRLSEDLDDLMPEMLARIAVADPIEDLQRHLQLRLAPVEVYVAGRRPIGVRRRSEHATSAAREYLGVVALADQLADILLGRFPPGLDGRSRLEEVDLTVSPEQNDVRISVRPRPASTNSEGDLDGLVSTLALLHGYVEEGFEDGGMTFRVSTQSVALP
jgi:hypothetical protein